MKGLNESITLAGHGPQTELQLISPSVKKRNIKQKTAATTTASKQIILKKTNKQRRAEKVLTLALCYSAAEAALHAERADNDVTVCTSWRCTRKNLQF